MNVWLPPGGQLRASATVTISILYKDEFDPVASSKYTFVVSYNAQMGHSVGYVAATDADKGTIYSEQVNKDSV